MQRQLLLAATIAATLSLSAAPVVANRLSARVIDGQTERLETNRDLHKRDAQKRLKQDKRRTAPVRKAVAEPGANDAIITVAPEGTSTNMEKFGFSYGYSWFTGLVSQSCDGSIQNMVKTAEGEIYLNNPLYFFFDSEESYIKGKLEGDIVTFTFPQLIAESTYEDYDGNPIVYKDYILKLEFIEDEEDPGNGWYYPCEDQTYKMRLLEDGTLESLDSEANLMLGQCEWFEEDEEGPAGWSWQGNGDFYDKLVPFDKEPVRIPENLTTEKWDLIDGISARKVSIAFDNNNNKVYIAGMFNKKSVRSNAVVGEINGDIITIADNQYLGIYDLQSVYFQSWKDAGDNNEESTALSLKYDAEKKSMKALDGESVSFTSADGLTYWVRLEEPYICYPNPDAVITKLQNPVIARFWEYDPDWGDPNEMMFDFPIVDAEQQVISDTSKLFYQVFMDGELYTFYNDEYILPEGVEEMTDVPYDYTSEENADGYCDFEGGAVSHDFLFYPVGFETLGIRTLYKDGDRVIYSDIVYPEGFAPGSSVKTFGRNANVVKSEVFDLNGRRVSDARNGIFVVRQTTSDGEVIVNKVVK